MKDRIYYDTNIFIYLVTTNDKRKDASLKLLESHTNEHRFISTQVISESVNTCLRKKYLPYKEIPKFIDLLTKGKELLFIKLSTIKKALKIQEKYKLSYYDCQHIAVALENKCNILYSENMHHYQNIEGMKIINPYIDSELSGETSKQSLRGASSKEKREWLLKQLA